MTSNFYQCSLNKCKKNSLLASMLASTEAYFYHKSGGYLFEPGNVNELREKLIRLWNNKILINEMGAKARKYIYDIANFEVHWSKLNSINNNITVIDT